MSSMGSMDMSINMDARKSMRKRSLLRKLSSSLIMASPLPMLVDVVGGMVRVRRVPAADRLVILAVDIGDVLGDEAVDVVVVSGFRSQSTSTMKTTHTLRFS